MQIHYTINSTTKITVYSYEKDIFVQFQYQWKRSNCWNAFFEKFTISLV